MVIIPSTDLEPGKVGKASTFAQMNENAQSTVNAIQKVTMYNTSGTYTYTKPTGLVALVIMVQGAGGGGASSSSTLSGYPGAAGAFIQKYLDADLIDDSNTIVVGSGGSSSSGTGGTGDSSSFSNTQVTYTCNGGTGGSRYTSAMDAYTGRGGAISYTGDEPEIIWAGGKCEPAAAVFASAEADNSLYGFTGGHSYLGYGGRHGALDGTRGGGGAGGLFDNGGGGDGGDGCVHLIEVF